MRIETHRVGLPSWIELPTPDPVAAEAFFGALLGWQPEPPRPRAAGYRRSFLRGQAVAGFCRQDRPGRPGWLTYFTVSEVDRATQHVLQAGGMVLREPYELAQLGRAAVCADPTGAVFAICQPGEQRGPGLAREVGAVSRHELETRDPAKALPFYQDLFGWVPSAEEVSGRALYDLHLYDDVVAGLMPMGAHIPAEVPPHWMIYFDVTDPDEAAARTRTLGGEVYVPPTDVSVGRFAVLGDPHGAVFGVLRMG